MDLDGERDLAQGTLGIVIAGRVRTGTAADMQLLGVEEVAHTNYTV